MKNGGCQGPKRRGGAAAVLIACLSLLCLWMLVLPGLAQHPEPPAPHFSQAPRPSPQPARPGQELHAGPGQPQARGQHLPEWMANHQNLNPQQQEQALRREPGFSRLPPTEQQHLIDRLHKLDSAPPQVRQRILARNEMFERLPPEQKQGIRAASQALEQMPQERNMAVRRAFRELRGLTPGQRQLVINSARFQADFSPQERNILGSLLSIEPYQP